MTENNAAASSAQPTAGGSATDHVRAVGEVADSLAPMPTRRTIRIRTFLPYQAYRFGVINLKMLKVTRRSQSR